MHRFVAIAALLHEGVVGDRAVRIHADRQGLLAGPDAVGPAHLQRVLGNMDFGEGPARAKVMRLPVVVGAAEEEGADINCVCSEDRCCVHRLMVMAHTASRANTHTEAQSCVSSGKGEAQRQDQR